MKNLKPVDVVILLAVIAALVVGFFTYKHFRETAGNKVLSTSKIIFQVYLRGVTITGSENPIKAGDDTFISIRNVPYTNLKVLESKIDTKKVVVPTLNPKQPFVTVNDYSQMYMYDIVVTVMDTAKITKDGPVVGGNKVKIGMPITLEGSNYKFNGPVSNIQVLTDAQADQIQKEIDKAMAAKQAAEAGKAAAPQPGQPQAPVAPGAPVNTQPQPTNNAK